jgi:citrate synthase
MSTSLAVTVEFDRTYIDGINMVSLTTREVAERLGVKRETVYAYVSRGLLTSRRGPGGRASTFDQAEVDALARRQRRSGAEAVRTRITLIAEDGRLYYRGVDVRELAMHFSFEEVADWLWTGRLTPGTRFTTPPDALRAARQALAGLPPHSGLTDRLRVAVVAASLADPLRFDLSDEMVTATGRALIATLVDALPVVSTGDAAGGSIAARLWPRLTARPAGEPQLRCLDAALVLLTDHDLAASTLAARVAASARAHPYAVVSAGLGVLEGPLHGGSSALVHRMLVEVLDGRGAAGVVADHLRSGRRIPGVGHRIYRAEDPRVTLLFDLLESMPETAPALAAARQISATAAREVPLHANVDLALAVLSVSADMPAEAGELIFAVARTAGWVAHALEEYHEQPMRMRPSGHYTGPPVPQPLPD